jgi:hypothetical protein
MSRRLSDAQVGKRTVEVIRDAVKLVDELVEQGLSVGEMEHYLVPCTDAHYVLNTALYRIRGDKERRQTFIQGLRMALEFVERHQDPEADLDAEWIVERLTHRMLGSYDSYQRSETRLKVQGFASYYLQAADQIDHHVKNGLVRVCTVHGKFFKEMDNKPMTAEECVQLPDGVMSSRWEPEKSHDLAEQARTREVASGKLS